VSESGADLPQERWRPYLRWLFDCYGRLPMTPVHASLGQNGGDR
jgi:hypothetical protein